MKDEIWITKDGKKISVGDMEESHVRNALRMVIRQMRESLEEPTRELEPSAGDMQDMLHAQAMLDLANPNAFFPLLEGGVYGSPELYKRHAK